MSRSATEELIARLHAQLDRELDPTHADLDRSRGQLDVSAPNVSAVHRAHDGDRATTVASDILPWHRRDTLVPSAVAQRNWEPLPTAASVASTVHSSRRSASADQAALYRQPPSPSAAAGQRVSSGHNSPTAHGLQPTQRSASAGVLVEASPTLKAARAASLAANQYRSSNPQTPHRPAPLMNVTAPTSPLGASASFHSALRATSDREQQLLAEVGELRSALLAATQAITQTQRDRKAEAAKVEAVAAERDDVLRALEHSRALLRSQEEEGEKRARVLTQRAADAERERDEAQATVAAADTALRRLEAAHDDDVARLKAAKEKMRQERRARAASDERVTKLEKELTDAKDRLLGLRLFVAGTLKNFVADASGIIDKHPLAGGANNGEADSRPRASSASRRRSLDAGDTSGGESAPSLLGARGQQQRRSSLGGGSSSTPRAAGTPRTTDLTPHGPLAEAESAYEIARARILRLSTPR
jgi:hypothetical protein